jgi:hypothetical protein
MRSAVSRGVRMLAWTPLFFLLAILPRLSTVLAGTTFRDDFVHIPSGHLLSHRLTNFLELGWWMAIVGDRYLIGSVPKLIAAAYTAMLCWSVRSLLLRWNVSVVAATTLAILIPLHPIWNTFISWNVCAVYVLSLLLMVLGYTCLTRETLRSFVGGVLLLYLGVASYQVHIGLLLALIVFELAQRRPLSWAFAGRRLGATAAVLALYGVSSLGLSALGYTTWGGRGLSPVNFAHLRRNAQAIMDNLATLTQPLLSFAGGVEVSWRWWWLPYLVAAIATGAVVLARNRDVLRALITASLPIAMPVCAAAVILPLNVGATGPRVAGAIWIALLFALAPLFDRAIIMRGRLLAWCIVSVLAALAATVSVADAQNRTRAWKSDLEVVNSIRRYWSAQHVPLSTVTIAITPPETASAQTGWASRPIVLQNFSAVTPLNHSNILYAPEYFFPAFGLTRVTNSTELVVPNVGNRMETATTRWTHLRESRTTVVTPFQSP